MEEEVEYKGERMRKKMEKEKNKKTTKGNYKVMLLQ
jgi:hypothetical protein